MKIVRIFMTTLGASTGPNYKLSSCDTYGGTYIAIAGSQNVLNTDLLSPLGYEVSVPYNTEWIKICSTTGDCPCQILYVVPSTTTTTTTPTPTTTTTTTPALLPDCYEYTICADDGTLNRNSYPYSYYRCDGVLINATVVNRNCLEFDERIVCAREDSVTVSEFVTATKGGPCTSPTTTTTSTTEPTTTTTTTTEP